MVDPAVVLRGEWAKEGRDQNIFFSFYLFSAIWALSNQGWSTGMNYRWISRRAAGRVLLTVKDADRTHYYHHWRIVDLNCY